MALNIGRKGWAALGLQSAFQVPATLSNSDYVYFETNTVQGQQDQLEVDHATSLRDKIANTVAGKRWSEGDFGVYADPTYTGYLLVAALGTVQTVSLGSGVSQHTITRNNSNTPQYLTMITDRGADRQIIPDLSVDEFTLSVGTDLAEASAKLVGNFPQTTTSGTVTTTTSGNVFSFANAQFAFGTTISGAQAATPLKPHDFTFTINNNAEAVFAHSTNGPRSINQKEFTAKAEFTLYFENTTDRDAYYNQSKQSASFELYGNGIGGGFTESLVLNMYKTSVQSFSVDTGLDDYFAEKVTLTCEFDPTTGRTVDAVLVNRKSLYI